MEKFEGERSKKVDSEGEGMIKDTGNVGNNWRNQRVRESWIETRDMRKNCSVFTFEKGFYACLMIKKWPFSMKHDAFVSHGGFRILIEKERLMEDEWFDEKTREVLEVQRRRN